MTQELENRNQASPAEAYWADLTSSADQVQGADLEKGANLIGVPHCITQAVFRQGDFLNQGITGWYVSLEAVVAPAREIARALRRGRIPEGTELTIEPGECVVYNEGGTGVYRQIVAYLEAKKLITLPEGPEQGKYGDSRFDTLPPEWTVNVEDIQSVTRIAPDGERTLTFDIKLLCPRGLRQSKYENEYTKQGVTRYLG